MKKLGLIIILVLLVAAQYVSAYTIPSRTRATVNESLGYDILIHRATEQAIVTMRNGNLDRGNFTGIDEDTENFINVTDDPDTVEDETSTAYTDFLSDIGFSWTDVEDAVKAKRGL